jgi:hypothetical protein
MGYLYVKTPSEYQMATDLVGSWYGTYDLWRVVNIYSSNPNGIYNSLKNSFIPNTTNYYRISGFIPKDDSGNITLYRGDCFMQRTTARLLHWKDNSDGEGWDDWEEFSTEGDPKTYSHGKLISFITENVTNTAMRDDDQGNEAYFPKVLEGDEWANKFIFEKESKYIKEALYYNTGYHKTLSMLAYRGFDGSIPHYESKKVTRIRQSSKHTPGQIYDAWRVFDIIGYEDYPVAYGDMIRLFEHMGVLGSVQTKAINRHYTDDKELRIPTSQADIVLGSNKFLSDQVIRIAEYGSQHILSMCNAKGGFYGVDYDRMILWSVKTQMSDYGQLHLNVFDLGEEKFIYSEVRERLAALSVRDELPYEDKGILLGYDEKNKELNICILPGGRTLVFNETLQEFTGDYPYNTKRFVHGSNELLSIKKDGGIKIYRHLQEDSPAVVKKFHESDEGFKLSWVVSGQEGKEMLVKAFEYMEIESLDKPYDNISLETSYQSGNHAFITGTIESETEYAQGLWQVPLPMAENGGGQFEIGSQYNGTYLKVTLEHKGNEKQFVRHVKTIYNNVSI